MPQATRGRASGNTRGIYDSQSGFESGRQRSFASYYNDDQAHFGPPGSGPDAYFGDERFFGESGGHTPSRGGRDSMMMMQDGWYKGGPGAGMPTEFEDEGYGMGGFSDEDIDELDLRQV